MRKQETQENRAMFWTYSILKFDDKLLSDAYILQFCSISLMTGIIGILLELCFCQVIYYILFPNLMTDMIGEPQKTKRQLPM